LGPWVHGVDSTATPKAGDREFSSSAVVDYDAIVLRWMDHYLRGINNGVEREQPVRYFVMGENKWRETSNWPPPAKPTSYYLYGPGSSGKASLTDVRPTSDSEPMSFVSDPENPVRNPYPTSGAHDYRDFVSRKDVLTFDSVELTGDLEVSGPIKAH